MRFHVLGPLEVLHDGRPIHLGGARQRATLALLLLRANRVVATSELLKALWSVQEGTPPTARKIVQNAVRGLRTLFAEHGCAADQSPLLTRSPGYVLRVEPDQVDLYHFYRTAKTGRAELAAGSPEAAATTLREALGLWRGSALADLVETGVTWPELTAVQNERLQVIEDYFAAELASGRHQAVLRELEVMAEAEPLRERLSYWLMLALYRSGRQVDALNVYTRVRSAMVERLGLEPGRNLQMLQRAILVHDPTLALPERTVPPIADEPPAAVPPTERKKLTVITVRTSFDPGIQVATTSLDPTSSFDPTSFATTSFDTTSATNTSATFDSAFDTIDDTLDTIDATIRAEAARFDGTVVASVGGESLVIFGESGWKDEDAAQAVWTALAIRDRLAATPGPASHLAVATGQARVRHNTGDAAPAVRGALLLQCQGLLAHVRPGEILVCAATRRSSQAEIGYERADFAGGWRVLAARDELPGPRGSSIVARELKVLDSLLEYVRERAMPHLVTVLGVPGRRMSHFLAGFAKLVAGYRDEIRFVSVRGVGSASDSRRGLQGRVLAACCGIDDGEPTEVAWGKLDATVRRLVGPGLDADWLTANLAPLAADGSSARSDGASADCMDDGSSPGFVTSGSVASGPVTRGSVTRGSVTHAPVTRGFVAPGSVAPGSVASGPVASGPVGRGSVTRGSVAPGSIAPGPIASGSIASGSIASGSVASGDELTAWRCFVQQAALERPLVLAIDNLHRCDESLLDFVEQLTDSAGPVPLFVLVTAWPELLDRRPGWGGGKLHATTMTLDALRDTRAAL